MSTRRTIAIICMLCLLGTLLVDACRKSTGGSGSSSGTPVTLDIPDGFPAVQYDFTNNPLTEEGIALGRKLFYDGRLSKDGNFPCASCHQQFAAFATYDHNLSHGYDNQFTTRNAPALFNLAWQTNFHWDGGINNLEVQPLAPLTAPNEMAENIDSVLNKLKADDTYLQMFNAAFGSKEVSSQRMLKALAQFMLTMVSANSKYDKVKKGEASFSAFEEKGYEIFQEKQCNSCHVEPLFTDLSYRNTGLTLNTSLKDSGRMRITGLSSDSLKFKVPSLRNIYVSFPYGHDGRFSTITQMLEHYNSGVQSGPTTDPLVANGISLSYEEQFYLVQFLNTLTDSSFLADTQFSQPAD